MESILWHGIPGIERDKWWDPKSTGADVAEDIRQHGGEVPDWLQ